MNNKEVFISHSSNDRQIAIALCNYLESRNINCWMAPRNISVGKDYAQSIMEAIESSAIMILILSDAANNSKHVRNEIERAFNHQLVIMPFRVENIMPGRSLEYFLSATHWLDAFDEKPEKYFPLLYANCKSILQADTPLETSAQTNIVARKKTPAPVKKYLLIALACVIVLAGAIFLMQTINSKKSSALNEKISNADSALAKNNDSDLQVKNKDSNTIKQNSVVPNSAVKSTAKKEEENTNDADVQQEKSSVHLPAAVNAVYWQPATNDVLTLSNTGYFSGTVQNKPVTGEFKSGPGKSYKLSGYHISGNISFSSDYNSFSGSIFFTDLGVNAKLDMVKK